MAEYQPLALPGNAFTGVASAAITGKQALKVSGSGTLAPATAASDIIVGIAAFDVANSGDVVTYFPRGTIHRLTASGAITAGQVVEGAAAGAVATHTQGTNDVRTFGVALTTAADTATVEIMEL